MKEMYYNLFLGDNVACVFNITNTRGNYKEILNMFKRKYCIDIKIKEKSNQADITLVLSNESQMNNWIDLLKRYYKVEKCEYCKEVKVY